MVESGGHPKRGGVGMGGRGYMSIAVAKNVVSVGLCMGTNRELGLSLMEIGEGGREGGMERSGPV